MNGRPALLLTGFEPFAGWSSNPGAAVARFVHLPPTPALAAERELARPGMPLVEQRRIVYALASEART